MKSNIIDEIIKNIKSLPEYGKDTVAVGLQNLLCKDGISIKFIDSKYPDDGFKVLSIDWLFEKYESEIIEYCDQSDCLELDYFSPRMMKNNFNELKILALDCYIDGILNQE